MKTLTNRHGHLDGFCTLRFFPGAEHKIVTCGSDSLVKVHSLDQVDDDGGGVADIDHFEKPVHAVAVRRDGALIAAGGEDREVSLFDSSTFDFMKNVARCTLPIRDLCFHPASSVLAVASDDENIMIVNTEDTSDVKTLKGHRGGVKSLAYDPKGRFLASTGTDCTLRVWDVEEEVEKKRYDKVYSTSSGAATTEKQIPVNLCNVSWSHDGALLAVAGNPEIKVFARDSWEEKEAFVGGSNKDVSCVSFSPNGLYLLSIDTAGLVTVWDVASRESITRYENPAGSKIVSASWDPVLNSIAMIAEDGSYGIVMDVIPSDRLGPSEMLDDDEEDAESFAAGGEEEDELTNLKDSPQRKSKASRPGLTMRSSHYDDEEAVERQPPFQPQVRERVFHMHMPHTWYFSARS
jgi:chromosome transmission fidelity protein 4